MSAAEDQALIESLRRGDKSALDSIFRQYFQRLCVVAYQILRSKDDAQDAVQDVFLRLWRNREAITINVSLQAYLKRAVVNSSLNQLKRNAKVMRLEGEDNDVQKLSRDYVTERQSADELAEHAAQVISGLPARTRVVYTLIRHEEMSYQEVADTLRISVKAVEKEMIRALKILRHRLRDYLTSSIVVLGGPVTELFKIFLE